MLIWILTFVCIAGLSAIFLELFQESTSENRAGTPSFGSEYTNDSESHVSCLWQTMSDEDLDALVNEFSNSTAADQRHRLSRPTLAMKPMTL